MEKRLHELAEITGARLEGDGSALIKGVRSIEDAGPGDITFIAHGGYRRLLESSRASAVIVREGERPGVENKNLLFAKNPHLAFAKVLELFRPTPMPPPGVHPKAEVHPGSRIGKDVSIQAFCVVEEGAVIGERTVLYPGVYVGRGASVGPWCVLHSGVAIREGCVVGSKVIIHCNAVIGSDGFGYAWDEGVYHKIPQKGIVRIGDDVEVGACAAIDRATVGETVVGRGTKIDNLVQIAHNVRIGEDSVIAAQTGIAGSSTVGNRVQFGGQVGVGDHARIGDDTLVGAQSGVAGELPGGSAFSGSPAIPHREWLRAQNIYAKLPELKKRLDELEKRVRELEKQSS